MIEYEKIENFDGPRAFEKIDHLLHTYSCETSDLIHEYYLNRYYQQQSIEGTEHGQLTVRCGFTNENSLEVNSLDFVTIVNLSQICQFFVLDRNNERQKFSAKIWYM